MKSSEMAREYIARASRTLEEARNAIRAGDHPLTIRRAQEAAELSLKAALRFVAIEYPREHDVRDVLLGLVASRRLPEWFEAELEFMAHASSDLARKRGPSFYGDEQTMKPPSDLFTRDDATKALEDAEKIYQNCKKLIETGATSASQN